MKRIIVAALFAITLGAAARPATAMPMRLSDAQLDRVTAGGAVTVTATGSAGIGFVIDTTTSGAGGGTAVGWAVSVSFGSNPNAGTSTSGTGTVFARTLSGGSGPIRFSVSVGTAL